jgi:hypothetical protein
MPNYYHWKDAIEAARKGRKRTKQEIQSFEDVLNAEITGIKEESGDVIDDLKDEITAIINASDSNKQKKIQEAFIKQLGDAKFKNTNDVSKLKKYLEVAKSIK